MKKRMVDMKKRLSALIVLISVLMTAIPMSFTFAENTDAITELFADSELEEMKMSTESFTDDGYIGIPYDITVYFDAGSNTAKPGYNGTVCVLYVVNSMAVRTGTNTDANIIKSMLERGCAVAVLDYKNNPLAITPDLEYSVQKVRTRLKNGDFFLDKTIFPEGEYYENHAVPAGHNITVGDVYFEIDKHGVDGILEKIIERWNVDFRGVKADRIIKWTDHNGNRKATQNGWDGSAPVWYDDAAGKSVDTDGNGEYIKAKHTWAQKIEDCVKEDGTPIDLNLYMHIIYPDKPLKEVPVASLSNSSEHLASGYAQEDRPYLLKYAFDGYAVAAYDYLYVPMARNDHYGNVSGHLAGGITGQDGTYSLARNKSTYHTAAMRYLRYLSLNDHENRTH